MDREEREMGSENRRSRGGWGWVRGRKGVGGGAQRPFCQWCNHHVGLSCGGRGKSGNQKLNLLIE